MLLRRLRRLLLLLLRRLRLRLWLWLRLWRLRGIVVDGRDETKGILLLFG
jgi:hypothetical protein